MNWGWHELWLRRNVAEAEPLKWLASRFFTDIGGKYFLIAFSGESSTKIRLERKFQNGSSMHEIRQMIPESENVIFFHTPTKFRLCISQDLDKFVIRLHFRRLHSHNKCIIRCASDKIDANVQFSSLQPHVDLVERWEFLSNPPRCKECSRHSQEAYFAQRLVAIKSTWKLKKVVWKLVSTHHIF